MRDSQAKLSKIEANMRLLPGVSNRRDPVLARVLQRHRINRMDGWMARYLARWIWWMDEQIDGYIMIDR